MSKIKEYLKKIGVKQKDLAERLGITRQTLGTYIELYENGKMLPRANCNIIFDCLFNSLDLSAMEFEMKFQNIERYIDQKEHSTPAGLSADAVDYVDIIVDNIRKDMSDPGWNTDIYTFINLIILNYRKERNFVRLAEYFSTLNNAKELSLIEENQVPYYANLYKLFKEFSSDEVCFERKDFEEFLEQCEKLSQEREMIAKKTQKELQTKIIDTIVQYQKKGMQLDKEELIIEAIRRQFCDNRGPGDGERM